MLRLLAGRPDLAVCDSTFLAAASPSTGIGTIKNHSSINDAPVMHLQFACFGATGFLLVLFFGGGSDAPVVVWVVPCIRHSQTEVISSRMPWQTDTCLIRCSFETVMQEALRSQILSMDLESVFDMQVSNCRPLTIHAGLCAQAHQNNSGQSPQVLPFHCWHPQQGQAAFSLSLHVSRSLLGLRKSLVGTDSSLHNLDNIPFGLPLGRLA